MSELDSIKPFSLEKGFDRLIFDLAQKKIVVGICIDGLSGPVEGKILKIENNVLALAVGKDRFDFDVWYIPTSAIRSVSVNKSLHTA